MDKHLFNRGTFPLISMSDNVSSIELTLILEVIVQCDVKHIMMLLMKTMTSLLKVSTYIITSDATHPTGVAVILAIMSRPSKGMLFYIYCRFLCGLQYFC